MTITVLDRTSAACDAQRRAVQRDANQSAGSSGSLAELTVTLGPVH